MKENMKAEKSKYMQRIIAKVERAARKNKAKAWHAIAENLKKPRRNMAEVNVGNINRCAEKGETVVIPGKVLGSGVINKSIRVVALSFSKSAEKKIKEAKGECIKIEDFLDKNPEGKKIKIMK